LQQEALGHIIRYADIHLALRRSLKKIAANNRHFEWHFNTNINELSKTDLADVTIHAEGGLFNQQDWQDIYRDYQQSAIVGWAKLDQNNAHLAWERFTEEGPLALLPSHKGPEYSNLVWCGHPDASNRRLTLPKEVFIKELQEAFGSRAGHFLDVGELRSYDLGLNARKNIIGHKEVWIGNAAQTMHPVAGQGLNLGLRDAHTLAEELSNDSDIQTALNEYQKRRQSDRKATIGTTDFLARIFTSKLKPIIWARGIALSGLQLVSPIKQALTRQMMFGQR
jgi:2-octaprenyl-6-methoxyphenol hydroxylase